jgi:hypothetical protein
LHDIIDDHEVFDYSHGTKPGEASHKVDTWDIIALADAHSFAWSKRLQILTNRLDSFLGARSSMSLELTTGEPIWLARAQRSNRCIRVVVKTAIPAVARQMSRGRAG